MAKDILGREIDPNTSAGAYRKMADNANVMQAAGKGTRTVADAAGQALKNMGSLANQSPKLLGVPAAGIANLAATGGANFMTGFTGQQYTPNTYEAKSFTDMFGGGRPAAPVVAPTTSPATTALPGIKPNAPSTYVPGAGLPSADQIASDKSRALLAQRMSDEALGGDRAVGNITVTKQANGNLSFSGKDIGPGAGVNYTGMPNWTSQKGGAGQGAVGSWNLGEQNARMAAVLQGFKAEDAQKQRMDLINQIASGAGGAIGVARNKMALAGLGEMLDAQAKNATALQAAGMQTGAQLAGQQSAEKIAANRDATTRTGYEMQKETAMSAQEVEKERNGLTAAINKQKALGNPVDQQKWALEFATRTGTDLATGKKLPAAQWNTLKETANILKFGFAAPQQEGE